jgi:hypothetical protein
MIEMLLPEGIAIMMRQRLKSFTTYGALLLGMLALPWHASSSAATIIGTTVTLSSLLTPGGTITAGDKTFSNFTYNFTGNMPTPVNVNVIPITDNSGNFGVRFQGAFIDSTLSAGGSDALITYDVTADAAHLISDAHIEGNTARMGAGGSISVTDTFLPLGGSGEFTMKIYDDQTINPPKLIDNTVFTTPMKTLSVQKDILGLALTDPNAGNGTTVTLSFVDQTYSQITIPEPAATILLLGGVFGFTAFRRRNA